MLVANPRKSHFQTTKTKGLPAVARRDTNSTLVSTALTSGGWRAACAVVYAAVLVQPRGPEVATGVRIDTDGPLVESGLQARGSLQLRVESLGRDKTEVSRPNAGHHPIWSSDGKELFYEPAQFEFVVVPVRTEPSFTLGNPVSWPGIYGSTPHLSPRNRDIGPDAKRFISLIPADTGSVQEIRVVLNWFEDLKRRVPTK